MLNLWKIQKSWAKWEYKTDIINVSKLMVYMVTIGIVTISPIAIPSLIASI
tara:strand:+ start:192 stop:344 length:153 start_codon:yes stop_codon:yes gene_type:complete